MISVQPVILCGGSGTRLWPLSRAGFPEQFLCLTSKESLFQQAARRLAGLGADDLAIQAPIIITGEEHRFLAAEQLREAGIELGSALLEPIGRNTALALTLAAQQDGTDPVLVVTPADQTVANPAAFTAAMQTAIREAGTDSQGQTNIVTCTHAKLDLTYQAAVRAFFETEKLDQACLAAAKVGGIHANNTYE